MFCKCHRERILYLELYPITVHNATMTPVVLLCWPFGPSHLSLACICRLPVQNTKIPSCHEQYGHDESHEEADNQDDINDSADEGDKKLWADHICVCR